METRVNKVLGQTVTLANGQLANIAVFAYNKEKDTGRQHMLSGAAACDRAAAQGKRAEWIVQGRTNEDGSVSISKIAYKTKAVIGSFVETFEHEDLIYIDETKLGKNVRLALK